ncbi:L-alanine-DL-glutamate epimerase-like enolase superfamily enzyme [Bradyrhizobium sp. GM6.1]
MHLLAGRDDGLVEMFYLKREACLWGGRADVDATGHVAVPTGPGLGYEPARSVMERYRVA